MRALVGTFSGAPEGSTERERLSSTAHTPRFRLATPQATCVAGNKNPKAGTQSQQPAKISHFVLFDLPELHSRSQL
eukprot:567334-Pyramimonas_sp.AAC.1